MTLALSAAQWAAILRHVQSEAPNEACGLLGGTAGRVQQVYPVENAAHSPWTYRMEAGAQVRAMLEIEAAGWELLAIFHSHPAGPPVPSGTDVAQAYYPDSIYLILAPGEAGEWQGRAFNITAEGVSEVPFDVGR